MRSTHRASAPLTHGTTAAELEEWLKQFPATALVSADSTPGDRMGEPTTYSITVSWSDPRDGQAPSRPVSGKPYSGPDYTAGPDGVPRAGQDDR
jgi:hypothetical protein